MDKDHIEYLNKLYMHHGDNNFHITDGGLYASTPWHVISGIVQVSQGYGLLDPKKKVCVAGSGDGRIPLFFSMNGYDVVGIEIDLPLYKKSVGLAKKVQNDLGLKPVKIINGDFSDVSTYGRSGVDFGDIGTFYHGINMVALEKLVSLINVRSDSGTSLLLYKYKNPDNVRLFGLKQELPLSFGKNNKKYAALYKKP